MSKPNWCIQKQEITHAFVRGTRRVDLPLLEQTPEAKLGLLAAVATTGRFSLPTHPESFENDKNLVDSTRMAGVEIRSALCRYFRANRKPAPPTGSVYRVFERCRQLDIHMHRFDYTQLKHLLSIDADLFDTPFRRWASAGESRDDELTGTLTEENWLEFPTAERCNYIKRLHQVSPDKARQLLGENISSDTAATRGSLIESIAGSVSSGDQALLESLLTDRAKSVQDIVTRMLGGINGTAQYKERLDEAKSRLSVKVSKVLKQKKLIIDQPGGYKRHQLRQWYVETFGRIDPLQLAAHLELSIDEFCDLIDKEHLAVECIKQLAFQAEPKPMASLASRYSDAFMNGLMDSGLSGLDLLSDTIKEKLWVALLTNASMEDIPSWIRNVQRVHLSLKSPVPSKLSLSLVTNPKFKKQLKALFEEHESRDFYIVENLVTVLHSDCYAVFSTSLEGVSSVYTSQANQLIALLTLLEADQ